ncbi:MAG TPA: hypothetical protein VHW67_07275 [Solirubrobacteraceae bacterium]|jgi:mycobactin lysine-N-oxygenase|nr:hypothetical protein [Solirubrobacteraceae bacterium]
MPSGVDVTVVGAGAKATAIAAKVHAINRLGLARVSLSIIEDLEHAASWMGRNGMTSGKEILAITPLKDVGFPYESRRSFGDRGEAVDGVLAELSWSRYLIAEGQYSRWLHAGAPPVRHRDYGEYLKWALARATDGVEVEAGRVTQIAFDGDRCGWLLDIDGPLDSSQRRSPALVMTGPGMHRVLEHDAEAAPRLFHCDGPRSDFERLPVEWGCDIAIVGSGDSALSAAVFLRRLRPNCRLTVYTAGLPLSRGESFLENRVFSDPDCVSWEALDARTRRDFIRHADRGVFGTEQLVEVASDEACEFVLGRAIRVLARSKGIGIEYEAPEGIAIGLHDYVVNCTGFDLLTRLHALFPPAVRAEIEARSGPVWAAPPGAELKFGRMLELRGMRPLLHIPGLAAMSQGPGFANLGCLGLLSDRVLERFVRLDERSVHLHEASRLM